MFVRSRVSVLLSDPVLADYAKPSAGMLMQCPSELWPCTTPSQFTCVSQCLHFSWGTVRAGVSGIESVKLTVYDATSGTVLFTEAVEDFTLTSRKACGLSLAEGQRVLADLVVVNGAGTKGNVSTTVLADLSPPRLKSEVAIANGYVLNQETKYWNRSDIAVASIGDLVDDYSGQTSTQSSQVPLVWRACVSPCGSAS
jgi:hypothetical protein